MKKQFIALMIIVMLIASVHLFAASSETSSVTDTVGTETGAATGVVVSLGLSSDNGLIFSLSGPVYSAVSPGAPALAPGSGSGITYGKGARLQYTLYGAGESTDSFQIDAALADTQPDSNVSDPDAVSGQLYVGICDLPSTAQTHDDRTSGSIGSIVTASPDKTPSSGDYVNGESGITISGNDGTGGTLGETDLAMYSLTSSDSTPVSVTLIDGIDPVDSWTGTATDDGAQLFYELLQKGVNIDVTYTLKATAI